MACEGEWDPQARARLRRMSVDALTTSPSIAALTLPWESGPLAVVFGGTQVVPKVALDIEDAVETATCRPLGPEEPGAPSSQKRAFAAEWNRDAFRRDRLPEKDRFGLVYQEWLQVVLPCAGDSVLGHMLVSADNQAEKLSIVTQTLGGKALSTLEKRLRQVKAFLAWALLFHVKPFPLTEHVCRMYLKKLVEDAAPASRIKGVLEMVSFLRHVVGLPIAENAGDSPWIRGVLRNAAAGAKPTAKARPLTVGEVSALEEFLKKGQGAVQDLYAAGCFLFLVYSRARFGDCKEVSNVVFDLIQRDSDVVGYAEVLSWSHKMRRHFPSIPLVAPVQGATQGSWIEQWRRVATEAGLPLERLAQDVRGPLLPLPSQGGWLKTSCSTNEARAWMVQLLCNLGYASATSLSAHSCKATCLSWCAKYGIAKDVRTRLGNHNDRGSAECYARDTLASPLRDLEACILAIRTGTFLPDVSRSGYFPEASAQAGAASEEPSESRADEPLSEFGGFNVVKWPSSLASASPEQAPESPCYDARDGDQSEATRDPSPCPARAGMDGSRCSESSSSSSSSSTDSEVESEPGPHLAQLDEPEWRPECQIWQHRHSRTVHLLPLADVDKGYFVCGRAKSSAYFKFSGQPIVNSLKCAQCDRGKTIRSTAQLVHVLEKKRRTS